MYDGTIFVGGEIGSYGSDAVDAELTKSDQDWLKRKLKVAEIGENFDVSKMKKIVAGKKLWNYDNCLLYTSPSPRDNTLSRMPSSA